MEHGPVLHGDACRGLATNGSCGMYGQGLVHWVRKGSLGNHVSSWLGADRWYLDRQSRAVRDRMGRDGSYGNGSYGGAWLGCDRHGLAVLVWHDKDGHVNVENGMAVEDRRGLTRPGLVG